MSPIVTLPKGGLAGAMYKWVRGYPAKEKRNTEGFDTLNLKEAKALLDRINPNLVRPTRSLV